MRHKTKPNLELRKKTQKITFKVNISEKHPKTTPTELHVRH